MNIRRMMLLVLLALLSLSSCTGQIELTKPDGKRHVEFIMRSQDSDYWKIVRMGAEVAAKEFEVNIDFRAPGNEADVNGQAALMEQSIESGPDAIILAANDYKGLGSSVDHAADLRIPVITVDSEVDSDQVRSYIGASNYEAGKLAGRKLAELSGGDCRIAIVNFKQNEENSKQREQGVLDAIADYPNITVVEKAYSLSDPELAGQQTRDIIQKYGDIDGIVALNEMSSIGAATEIQELGLQGVVKLITFDSAAEELELLQEGVIQATIIRNPYSMGYLGVKYAVEAMDGKKVPDRVDTGIKAIDLGNMFWSDNQKLLFPFVK